MKANVLYIMIIKKYLRLYIYIFILIGALLIAIITINEIRIPYNSFLWGDIQNFGHVPFFGVLALFVLTVTKNILKLLDKPTHLKYVISFIISTFTGVGLEISQYYSPRTADIVDVLRDLLGIVIALCLYFIFDKEYNLRFSWFKTRVKLIILILSFICLSLTSLPVVFDALGYLDRNNRFPVINDFESIWEKRFIVVKDATFSITEVPDIKSESKIDNVGKIEFFVAEYPAFEIRDLYSNWNGYSALAFNIFSNDCDTIIATVKIEDMQNDGSYDDRFNRLILIIPGINQIFIPLNDIKSSPKNRVMDLSNIYNLSIFLNNNSRLITLYIDDILLIK